MEFCTHPELPSCIETEAKVNKKQNLKGTVQIGALEFVTFSIRIYSRGDYEYWFIIGVVYGIDSWFVSDEFICLPAVYLTVWFLSACVIICLSV